MADNRQPILSVRNVKVHFKVAGGKDWPWTPKKTLKAVDGVSFDLYAGETLGVVGESGCGKSTLSRAILNLIPATDGEIVWMGKDLRKGSAKDWLNVRKDIQMIFQDPLASLNPRMTIAQIIGEPLRVHRPELSNDEVMKRVRAMMAASEIEDAATLVALYRLFAAASVIEGPFTVGEILVTPFPQMHGNVTSLGFRFGPIAYSTDFVDLPPESIDILRGVKVWVVDSLKRDPHPTHANVATALRLLEKVRPERGILTHMTGGLDYRTLAAELPDWIEPAYDGLTIEA